MSRSATAEICGREADSKLVQYAEAVCVAMHSGNVRGSQPLGIRCGEARFGVELVQHAEAVSVALLNCEDSRSVRLVVCGREADSELVQYAERLHLTFSACDPHRRHSVVRPYIERSTSPVPRLLLNPRGEHQQARSPGSNWSTTRAQS